MPLLSVVTSALAPRDSAQTFFAEAYESLTRQTDLGAWEWEWLVQEDGEHARLRDVLPDDKRVRYMANGRLWGIATTRNLALERARGDLVRVFDHDDVLLPRGLAVPLELFAAHPRAVWAAGERWILAMPDRTVHRTPLSVSVPEGLVPPGFLADLLERSGEVEIHGAGLTIRPDVLRAMGGWMAVPYSETIVPLLVAELDAPGAYSSEPTFLYRRWPGQVTQEGWLEAMRPVSRSILRQRLAALRARPD